MNARFGSFTLRVECPECGLPVPLNAPLERAECAACVTAFAVPARVFSELLTRFDDEQCAPNGRILDGQSAVAGMQLHAATDVAAPTCEKCGTVLDLEPLPRGVTAPFQCGGCGDPAVAFPTPVWLRELVPSAAYVVVTDATAAPGADPTTHTKNASHPIALPCPQCGASLHVTSETERTVPCAYCKTDVYLPDDLWRRMHPVKKMAPWFVRFEGPSHAELARERAAREASEAHERAAREAEVARLALDARHEAEARIRALDAPPRARRRAMVGATALFVLYGVYFCPIGPCGVRGLHFGHAEAGLDKLRGSSEAQALLGEDIGLPWLGRSHGASSTPVVGSKAAGSYAWDWSDGTIRSAVLDVGTSRIDLVALDVTRMNLNRGPEDFARDLRGKLSNGDPPSVGHTDGNVDVVQAFLRYDRESYHTLRVLWVREHREHPVSAAIEMRSTSGLSEAQRRALEDLPGGVDAHGLWQGDGATFRFDRRAEVNFRVDADDARNPRWRVEADTAWKIMCNVAFGVRVPLTAAEASALQRSS